MGKMALLIVLGLSVVVGIITFTINRSKSDLSENVSGFDKLTNVKNIAHTAVNMILRRIDDRDTSITNHLEVGKIDSAFMIAHISSGICSVSVKLTNINFSDTLDIRCRARYMDSTHYMKIRMRRQPVPFPSVNEALGLRVPDVKFTIKGTGAGKGFIDGRNHNAEGVLTTRPDTNDKPGVGVLAAKDTTDVLVYKDNIDGTQDVKVDTALFDPRVYVDEYINAADRVYLNSSTIAGTTAWGTKTAPEIVYCEGDVHISGTVTGWGILVVNGDLRISGRIDFHGLVVVYKESVIDVVDILETGGGAVCNVVGGMMMAGPTGSSFEMRGSQQTLYSKEALDLAKMIGHLQWYTILYWYE
ncbi:MAG: hypothetical protein HY964_08470 [Ignavibacteriales bacterium]|nr:hypothetical protein [Ignavibacteriales bacterium]